ncbi:MAG: DUF3090 family protein [Chloroflexota bacterium]
MTDFTHNFDAVDRITTDTIGPPGQRVFYFQVWQENNRLLLRAEKEQIRSLASSVEQLLDDLGEKNPQLATGEDMLIADMRLDEPIEVDFRIAQMGLGYDAEIDMVILIIQGQSSELDQTAVIRVAATRSQMRAFSAHANRVVSSGRPSCVQTLAPCNYQRDGVCMFCPAKN